MIVTPLANIPIVNEKGYMEQPYNLFINDLVNLINFLELLTGSGSPEGVVEAEPTKLYMDTAGTAGAILYIKRDADIGGDKSQGWILV